MKTKIISTVIAFALMIVISSCNVLSDQSKFRYLNKVAVTSIHTDTTSEILNIAGTEEADSAILISNESQQENVAVCSNQSVVHVEKEENKMKPVKEIGSKISSGSKQALNLVKPAIARHKSTCATSAQATKTDKGKSFLFAAIVSAALIAGFAAVWGSGGALVALMVFGPFILLAFLLIALLPEKQKTTQETVSAMEEPDRESAFIYESSPTGAQVQENTVKSDSAPEKKKSTPWGWIGMGGALLILTLCFGLGILLLAVVFALVAAVIASGIWIYNHLFSTNN
jgi:hypothetical protein